MSAVVIRMTQAGLIGPGGWYEATSGSLPVQRPRGQAHSYPARGACGRRETVRYESALVAGRRIGLIRGTSSAPIHNPARLNSSRAIRRPGAVSFGNTRFEFRQEPARCIADQFQGNRSFPSASASHEQHAAGVVGNVRKVVGEIRNV